MNDANLQQYIGFIQEVCAKYECTNAARPLIDGLHAFCEAAFQHPTFEDPAQHKAYWKNVFFRLKTISKVVRSLQNKLWNEFYNRSLMVSTKFIEKRDKSGGVLKIEGRTLAKPIELTFTMPYPDNYNIAVNGKCGKQLFETMIPETELASTEWQFDGTDLKDPFNLNFQAYNEILQYILSVIAPTGGAV